MISLLKYNKDKLEQGRSLSRERWRFGYFVFSAFSDFSGSRFLLLPKRGRLPKSHPLRRAKQSTNFLNRNLFDHRLIALPMALKESLERFKRQQEKCQTTLSSIAAKQTASRGPVPQRANTSNAPPAFTGRTPVASVKFSSDTDRLQHINSIRKAPVGAQIKRVIDLLYETRQSFSPEQINEVCYVDVKGNKAVFDSLKNNLKVHYDGTRFSYKAKHDVKDKSGLLYLIRKFPEGIAVIDLKDAYPNVMEDLQGLKAGGQIWLLSNFDSQEDIAYPNDPRVQIKVDDELKELFRSIELPRDMLDVEKDLQKNGMKPATNTAQRRAAAQMGIIPPKAKSKKKKHEITKRTKLTNAHLPELFQNLKN